MIFLTHFLRSNKTTKSIQFGLVISTLIYLLSWQFAQFSLCTQAASLFVAYSFGFMSKNKMLDFVLTQSIALLLCCLLMFANSMLLTSLFASLLCSIRLIIWIENILPNLENFFIKSWRHKSLLAATRLVILFLSTIAIKKCLQSAFGQEDDSHIWDILKSKFNSQLHTFDTRLYTCAKEFDFIEWETMQKLAATGVLVLAALNFVFFVMRLIHKYFWESGVIVDDEEAANHDNVVFYASVQLIAFTLMACLIMRLKLFWTPFLGVFASFIANQNSTFCLIDVLTRYAERKTKLQTPIVNVKMVVLVFLIGAMSFSGIANLRQQYAIQGEYSDYTLENVMNWINKFTRPDDALAGRHEFIVLKTIFIFVYLIVYIYVYSFDALASES